MAEPEPDPATLDRLMQVTLDERNLAYQSLDALDTKAGILLAADSLLVVAATTQDNPWIRVILIVLFTVAGIPAYLELRVTTYKTLGTRKMLDKYWNGTPQAVTAQLLGNLAEYAEEFETTRKAKSRYVTWAFSLTAFGLLALAVASLLPTSP